MLYINVQYRVLDICQEIRDPRDKKRIVKDSILLMMAVLSKVDSFVLKTFIISVLHRYIRPCYFYKKDIYCSLNE